MIQCAICHIVIDGDMDWFVLSVVEAGDPTTGFLCSLDHLSAYVAKVYAADPYIETENV